MNRQKIRYAHSWEDPRLSREALAIGPKDDVLSIASGGENSLVLLLDRPRSATVIDRNPAQIYLVEIKILAMKELGYPEFLGFLGVAPCPDKDRIYAGLRDGLSGPSRAFWDRHRGLIRYGLFRCGSFERYFRAAFRFILPLIHSPRTVRTMVSFSTVEEQAAFYRDVWTNRRWRALFRVLLGEHLYGRLARSRAHYRYVTTPETWRHLYDCTTKEMSTRLVRDQPAFSYFFKDVDYPRPENYPLWIRRENFQAIRECLGRLRLRVASLEDVLSEARPGEYSRFNLSDVFEYMSAAQYENILGEMLRVSRPGGRTAFWTLHVPRPIPFPLKERFKPLCRKDAPDPSYRTWSVFEEFHAWEICGAG